MEIFSLNVRTNQNPIVIEIIIKKTNGDDISLDDCALLNNPASEEIENSNLLNCSYVLEISSQGVSDELTSERDFKTFNVWPLNIAGTKPNPNRIFSFHESISLLLSIADTPLMGAGISGKSNLL